MFCLNENFIIAWKNLIFYLVFIFYVTLYVNYDDYFFWLQENFINLIEEFTIFCYGTFVYLKMKAFLIK